MFIIDSNITDLKVREKGIIKMLFSLNTHSVATPEMSVEEARCYIIFFRETGRASAYIGMYLPHTDKRYYYAYSGNQFPLETVAEVEEETRKFAEDMGFLLDEVNLSAMSPGERSQWLDEQTIFGQKKEIKDKPVSAQAKPVQPAAGTKPAPQPVATKPVAVPQPGPQPPTPVTPQPQTQPPAQPQRQQPQKKAEKPAPVQQPAPQTQPLTTETQRTDVSPPSEAEPALATKRPDDVMTQAIKAGIVRPPQKQLRKELRSVTGVVSKDREALARLFASF